MRKVLSRRTISIMFGITLLHPPKNEELDASDYKYIYEIIELMITNHKLIITAKKEDIPENYERLVADDDENSDDQSESVNAEKTEDNPEFDESFSSIAARTDVDPETDELFNDIASSSEVVQDTDISVKTEVVPEDDDELSSDNGDNDDNSGDVTDTDESSNDTASNLEVISTSSVPSSAVDPPKKYSLLERIIYGYKFIISSIRNFFSRFLNF